MESFDDNNDPAEFQNNLLTEPEDFRLAYKRMAAMAASYVLLSCVASIILGSDTTNQRHLFELFLLAPPALLVASLGVIVMIQTVEGDYLNTSKLKQINRLSNVSPADDAEILMRLKQDTLVTDDGELVDAEKPISMYDLARTNPGIMDIEA